MDTLGKPRVFCAMLVNGTIILAQRVSSQDTDDAYAVKEVLRIYEATDGKRMIAQPMADLYFGVSEISELRKDSITLYRELNPTSDKEKLDQYQEYWIALRAKRAGIQLSTSPNTFQKG